WTAKANVTCTADTGDYKVGSASVKCVIASGLGVNNLIATEDFTAVNMSSADGIELWIKSSINVNAGDFEIHLDNDSACASPSETIAVPALTAGKWDRLHLDLASVADATDIASIGLYQTTDVGPCTVHIDDVRLDYKYWYMTTGETFTRSTISNAYAEFLQMAHEATPALYLGTKPNEVRKATDASNNGSWGTITEIGNHDADMTEFLEWQNLLYVMKEDKPYYIDSSGNVQDDVAPELITEKATTSGKNAMIWHNKLYTQAGDQTLLEATTGGVNTFRSPADYITNDSNFTGQIFALAHDTFYMYAITDNSSKIEVIAMRLEIIEGVSTWVVHPIQEITLAGCETAYVSTIFKKRLWISSNASGGLDFDGASGLVTVTDDTTIQNIFDGGGTISAWVNPNSDGSGDNGNIISKTKWYLAISNESGGVSKIRFSYQFSGDDASWVSTTTQVPNNTWTHIAITYDASSTSNEPIIYVNRSVVEISASTPTGTRDTDVGSDMIVGAFFNGIWEWDGFLDDVRLYSNTLTATNIDGIYNSGNGTERETSVGKIFSGKADNMFFNLDYSTGYTATIEARQVPEAVDKIIIEQYTNALISDAILDIVDKYLNGLITTTNVTVTTERVTTSFSNISPWKAISGLLQRSGRC
ncbi:hypothetical protein LCGC14_2015190, partial [marine sediment metagenome]